jgi:uncharacterized RDD family membrane protein YckC
MAREQEKGSTGARSRYVWDPNKLTWVETVEEPPREELLRKEPVQEEPVREREVVEPRREREEVVEEIQAEPEQIEAVVEVEEVEYRGALIRLLGILIDVILLSIVNFIIGRITPVPSWTLLAVGFVYFVGFWSWRGQTIGKMLIGVKIVKLDGSAINIGNAILRYLFYLVPIYTPIIYFSTRIPLVPILLPILSLIIIGLSSKKRGIHDMIAGTCVINTRVGRLRPKLVGREPDTQE